MVHITSLKVKLPVVLLFVVVIFWVYLAFPTSNDKAVGIIGLILFAEAYFLGIDTSIIGRIIKMKPLSRIINGLYYLFVGVMALIVMALGQFGLFQWAFGVFLCIVGVSIIIYQTRKGPKAVFVKSVDVKTIPVSETKKGSKSEKKEGKLVAPQPRGFKVAVRKYEIYTYFVSLGSDLSVTVLFLAIFALMDFVSAFILFILGFLLRFSGDQIAKRSGVVKEQALPEEVPWR